MWHCVKPLIVTLLKDEHSISPKRAIVLVSPHLAWCNFTNNEYTIQLWAAAVFAVPYTQDIGQCVVDTLLLIESQDSLRSHLPVTMWSLLNKRPPLPPICAGRSLGTKRGSVQTVRRLGDIETLTSYLLLVWSEWDGILSGFEDMCTSIKEDFSGIRTGRHRKELLQRLDHVLGQLERGLSHLRQFKPSLPGTHIWAAKPQYRILRELLLEADREATDELTRETLESALLGLLLTPRRRVPLNIHVCGSSPVPLVTCLDHHVLHPRPHSSSYPVTRLLLAFSLCCAAVDSGGDRRIISRPCGLSWASGPPFFPLCRTFLLGLVHYRVRLWISYINS